MKTKVLNLLRKTKNVLFAALVSGLILEMIILAFPIKTLIGIPNLLNIYNYVLAVLALISLLVLISLPEEKNPHSVSHKDKPKSHKEKLGKFIFRGKRYPIRIPLFFLLGLISGSYIVLSFIFFEKIADINQSVRMILLFFGILYPLASFLIFFIKEYMVMNTFNLMLKVLGVEKNVNEIEEVHKGVVGGVAMAFDVLMYYIGGFVGWCLCLLIMFIILVPIGIFWIGKGFIWLMQHPNPWGILAIIVSLLAFLTFLTYRKWRDFNDFLDSLSFFPYFKI
jgi:hypothetical protein